MKSNDALHKKYSRLLFNAIHELACGTKCGVMFETAERISLRRLFSSDTLLC